MRAVTIGLAFALLAGTAAAAEQQQPSASEILDSAKTTAAAQHKTIFLIFGASW